MKTINSIDLKSASDPCFGIEGAVGKKTCRILCGSELKCGSSCPFYKPEDCKDWVRVEDEEGISLVPPEEYYAIRRAAIEEARPCAWKIKRVRIQKWDQQKKERQRK